MKDALLRLAIIVSVSILSFALWRGGVWLDSLMTVRTPFYYTFHHWASLIMCPLIGGYAGILYNE